MQNRLSIPAYPGSATPNLEGAPRSESHENRTKSVISPSGPLDQQPKEAAR